MAPPCRNFGVPESSKFESLENTPIFPALKCLEDTLRDTEKNFADKVSVVVSICPSVVEFVSTQRICKSTAEQIIEIVFYGVAEVVLNCRWLKMENVTKNHVLFTLNKLLNYSKAIDSVNHSKLIAYLTVLVKDPWGSLTLNKVMRDVTLDTAEVKLFLRRETIILIGLRVLSLIDAECEDLALKLVSFTTRYCGLPIKKNLNLVIRIVTNVVNQLEAAVTKSIDDRIRKIEKKLCSIFLVLFNIFGDCKGISREIILTAFSLKPDVSIFRLIRLCHERDVSDSKITASRETEENADGDNPNRCTSFGALTPDTGTFFTKSADYDPLSAPNDIIDDCERLNLSKENISDLISIISYPRYKRLSWTYNWEILSKNCEELLFNYKIMN